MVCICLDILRTLPVSGNSRERSGINNDRISSITRKEKVMQDKKEIRMKINDLLDTCEGCERVEGMSSSNIAQYCRDNCDTGKEIYELGKTIINDHENIRQRKGSKKKIDLEGYLDYKKEGWSDKSIVQDLGIGFCTLQAHKKRWGIAKGQHGGDRSNYYEEIMKMLEGNTCQTT